MRTEDLIDRLALDSRPGASVRPGVLAAWGPALAATVVLMLGGWGLRPGLGAAVGDPLVLAKLALPALAALLALAGSLRLARPEGHAGPALSGLGFVTVAALGLVLLGLVETPAEAWGTAFRGQTRLACLLSIPALAVIPTAALLAGLRRGASTRPALSGALAGLAGGAAAAAIYALHCPEDDPLFFVTWYGTGILIVGAAGALVAPRLLRW